MASVKMTSVRDFNTNLGHANNFLERMGHIPTYRNTSPLIEPGTMIVHRLPLPSSLPRPEDRLHEAGQPPPDRAFTETWP